MIRGLFKEKCPFGKKLFKVHEIDDELISEGENYYTVEFRVAYQKICINEELCMQAMPAWMSEKLLQKGKNRSLWLICGFVLALYWMQADFRCADDFQSYS